MAPHATRTVFVANIPYDVSEEQIANVFSEVGPVSNVEIKFDPQTGRSKGYAFVQFYDEATAHSAVRNLQDIPINGRPVRVELSTDDGPRNRRGPGGFGRAGQGATGMQQQQQFRDNSPPRFGRRDDEDRPPLNLSLLPAGQEVPAGQRATDAISRTLAEVQPGQMQEVMASMKTLIGTQPEQARQLLTNQPQLAYALFQSMLLMNIVDPSVLQRIQPLPPAGTAGPSTAPTGPAAGIAPAPAPRLPPFQGTAQAPPAAYPPYPATAGPSSTQQAPFRPPPGQAAYNAPPPPQAPQSYGGYPPAHAPAHTPVHAQPPAQPAPTGLAGLPAATQAQLAALPEDQRTMLVQVLQLTPDQINALDPGQQASVKQLRQQFLGTA